MMNSFKHGGNITEVANNLECDENEIIDLSSNINFVKAKIETYLNNIDVSKYQNYDSFYKNLADFYGIKPSQLEVYNGGSSAIFSFIRNSKIKNVYIYSPAYLEYKKACKIYDKNINLINRFYESEEDDNKGSKDKIKKGSIVIFVNPSTPDGKYYDLKKKLKYWAKKECTVLIDESFIDFVDSSSKKSLVQEIKNYKNLYILKSMTKYYSCASVRVGVIISCKSNIYSLKQNEPLWKISIFDRVFIEDIIKNEDFKSATKKKNAKAKEFLKEILNSSKHFEKVHQSDANFFLVELKKMTASKFQEKLLEYKIMVRDCSNFDFLNKYHVRIAVKSMSNLKLFKKALENIK